MSWFARSIAATLSSAPSDDEDSETTSGGDKSRGRACHPADAEEQEDEKPDTPSRGVKGDISELTESLTRRFWGVASYLAPPPPQGEAAEATLAEAATATWGEDEGARSPRIAGIRSDLAEIGGRVRSGISMLSNANAVAEISKIASSFLPFVPGEDDNDDDGEAVGVTEEVVVFVRHISTHPETWIDFPLFVNDRHADDFELSDTQYEHALAIKRIVPSLSYLRTELCSSNMSEGCFWKIYFVLLHSKLNKQDSELLSTPQILEAREELLQSSPTKKKLGSDGSLESSSVPSTQTEVRELPSSDIHSKNGMSEGCKAPLSEEPAPDSVPDVEATKHPISTTEVEVIDKSVIEEELVVKNEIKRIPAEKHRLPAMEDDDDDDDKDVDEWLQDMAPTPSKTVNATSIGHDEYVSFSDLEDDEDD